MEWTVHKRPESARPPPRITLRVPRVGNRRERRYWSSGMYAQTPPPPGFSLHRVLYASDTDGDEEDSHFVYTQAFPEKEIS